MKPIEYRHTLALYHKIREDLNRIAFILTSVVQAFLVLFYSYSIYSRKDSPVYIVLYSLLLAISLLVFVEEVLYQKKKKEQTEEKEETEIKKDHRRKRAVLKIISLISKLSILILATISIIQKGEQAKDLEKISTIALSILLLFQFCFLFISYLFGKYLTWLKKAIELDYQETLLLKTPSSLLSDRLHRFATKLSEKKDEDDDAFEKAIEGHLKKDEEDMLKKKKDKKEKTKQQRKEDLRIIKNHLMLKLTQGKISDKKIEARFAKELNFANQLITDKQEMDKFIQNVSLFLKDHPAQEELTYLNSYLTSLIDRKETLAPFMMIKNIINLDYYMNPILPNTRTVKDNLMINEMSEEMVKGYLLK